MQRSKEDIIKALESTPQTRVRKLVCGFGINDAPFTTSKRLDGKLYHHPAYVDWHNMINRCYGGKFPAYAGVTVAPEWRFFMNFLSWWRSNYRSGYSLDKDLRVEGNRVYGPDTCLYLPTWLNSHIAGAKGLARGVTFDKNLGKYKAQRSRNHPSGRYLGYFDTEEEAHAAWKADGDTSVDINSLDISIQELVLKRKRSLFDI